MTYEMALHIKKLIQNTPMKSLIDCQITLREIARLADMVVAKHLMEDENVLLP